MLWSFDVKLRCYVSERCGARRRKHPALSNSLQSYDKTGKAQNVHVFFILIAPCLFFSVVCAIVAKFVPLQTEDH